jgi:hypothetical protein
MAIFDEYRDQGHILMDSLGVPVKVTVEAWNGEEVHELE